MGTWASRLNKLRTHIVGPSIIDELQVSCLRRILEDAEQHGSIFRPLRQTRVWYSISQKYTWLSMIQSNYLATQVIGHTQVWCNPLLRCAYGLPSWRTTHNLGLQSCEL